MTASNSVMGLPEGQFRSVATSEMQSVSGGWYACLHYGLFLQAAAETQEKKLMDFLSDKISPKT